MFTKLRRAGAVVAAVAVWAGVSISSVQAQEVDVKIPVEQQNVVATLRSAVGAPKAPLVIMFHGFTGTRNELPVADTVEGVFQRMARKLGEQGYYSLRVDFRGSGDSDGAWEDTTFSSQIKDGLAVVDWARAQKQFDDVPIAILGWSQGGLVASHVAMERPDLDAVVLMAPATKPLAAFSTIFGADVVQGALQAKPETPITAKLPWGPETTLKARFYQEMPGSSPLAAIASYDGPLLMLLGTKDDLIKPHQAMLDAWARYHDGEEKIVSLETDHVWSAFSGPKLLDEQVIPEIKEWLDQKLKSQ